MIDTTVLDAMLAAVPRCDLQDTDCEGDAYEYGVHPTGVELGNEEGWLSLWYCSNCAQKAAWDA
ncbi:hypothetical protein [Streptacidiphilus sp. EB103A]|uniref:hypothetical protein n=1 Tax=Streptacidiphilus sp. EB103A TaxID=3156275 RepID=UPI003515E850